MVRQGNFEFRSADFAPEKQAAAQRNKLRPDEVNDRLHGVNIPRGKDDLSGIGWKWEDRGREDTLVNMKDKAIQLGKDLGSQERNTLLGVDIGFIQVRV